MIFFFFFIIDEDVIALLPDLEEYVDNEIEDEGLLLAYPGIQKRYTKKKNIQM